MSETREQVLARFNAVVAKRAKQPAALLELFALLKKSDKFPEEIKPACYAELLQVVTRSPVIKDPTRALGEIERYAVFAQLKAVEPGLVEAAAAATVRMVLQRVPVDQDQVLHAINELIAAGVAADWGEVFSLAAFSQLSMDHLDALADCTSPVLCPATVAGGSNG